MSEKIGDYILVKCGEVLDEDEVLRFRTSKERREATVKVLMEEACEDDIGMVVDMIKSLARDGVLRFEGDPGLRWERALPKKESPIGVNKPKNYRWVKPGEWLMPYDKYFTNMEWVACSWTRRKVKLQNFFIRKMS